jgi:hypothetical protein
MSLIVRLISNAAAPTNPLPNPVRWAGQLSGGRGNLVAKKPGQGNERQGNLRTSAKSVDESDLPCPPGLWTVDFSLWTNSGQRANA